MQREEYGKHKQVMGRRAACGPVLAPYCCTTNQRGGGSFRQSTIVLQFLWVRNLNTAQLGYQLQGLTKLRSGC
jgi:hypothetical protein